MSENTIMIRVVNQTHGLEKRTQIKTLLDAGAKLYHVDFRKFNDGTDGLFLCFDTLKQNVTAGDRKKDKWNIPPTPGPSTHSVAKT